MSSRRRTLSVLNTNRNNEHSSSAARGPKKATDRRLSLAQSSMSQQSRRQSMSQRGSIADSKGNRRQSMSRRSSMYGGKMSKSQDPRPVGEKPYTKQMIKTLIAFLSNHFYDRQITHKMLSAPTRKDFQHLLTFLLRHVDEHFEFSGSNFEQEVQMFMRHLGYPIPITKSALIAVSNPLSWPSLLAVLLWLVEYIQYAEAADKKDRDSLGNQNADMLFFDYAKDAYVSFMHGSDDFTEVDKKLEAQFESKNAHLMRETEQSKQINEELSKEIRELQNTQKSIEELTHKRASFRSDMSKFSKLLDQTRAHKQGIETQLVEKRREFTEQHKELASLLAEEQQLTEAISKQTISAAEVKRMRHKQALLDEQVAGLHVHKEKLQSDVWEEEMHLCKTVAAVEQNVRKYNESMHNIVERLGKRGTVLDVELLFNSHASSAAEMTNMDLGETVEPALASLRAEVASAHSMSSQAKRDAGRRLAMSQDAIQEQQEKVQSLTARFQKIEETYKGERAMMKEELELASSKVEDMELDMHRLKTAKTDAVGSSQGEIQKLEDEMEDLKEAQAEELAMMNREICQVMDAVATHKVQISKLLEQMEQTGLAVKYAVENDEEDVHLLNSSRNLSINSTM